MARFTQGQKVEANTTCQNMTQGEQFTVVDVHVLSTPFGDFVTYGLQRNNGETLSVGNGHLLLSEVA